MFSLLSGFSFNGITKEVLAIDEMLSSPYPYEQGLVKYIRNNGSFTAHSAMDIISHSDNPVKIEGYEYFNMTMHRECRRLAAHFLFDGRVTCHLFLSPKGSLSFERHTDPDDVVIHVVDGEKTFLFDDGSVTLSAGESLIIPKNTPHQAINNESSIMLSFGLESFIEQKLFP